MRIDEAITKLLELNDRLKAVPTSSQKIRVWYQAGSKTTYEELPDFFEGFEICKMGLYQKK